MLKSIDKPPSSSSKRIIGKLLAFNLVGSSFITNLEKHTWQWNNVWNVYPIREQYF
jgi:hypothetical protein